MIWWIRSRALWESKRVEFFGWHVMIFWEHFGSSSKCHCAHFMADHWISPQLTRFWYSSTFNFVSNVIELRRGLLLKLLKLLKLLDFPPNWRCGFVEVTKARIEAYPPSPHVAITQKRISTTPFTFCTTPFATIEGKGHCPPSNRDWECNHSNVNGNFPIGRFPQSAWWQPNFIFIRWLLSSRWQKPCCFKWGKTKSIMRLIIEMKSSICLFKCDAIAGRVKICKPGPKRWKIACFATNFKKSHLIFIFVPSTLRISFSNRTIAFSNWSPFLTDRLDSYFPRTRPADKRELQGQPLGLPIQLSAVSKVDYKNVNIFRFFSFIFRVWVSAKANKNWKIKYSIRLFVKQIFCNHHFANNSPSTAHTDTVKHRHKDRAMRGWENKQSPRIETNSTLCCWTEAQR